MNTITIAPAKAAAPWQSLVADFGSPLIIIDCARLLQQYQQLCDALPGVRHYFAIKALPHLSVLQTLAQAGAGFDLASSGEVDLLRQVTVSPRQTLYTHPIKRDSDIRSALRFGCTTFVVDNPREMEKFLPYRQRVALLIRLSFPNPLAPVDLSRKFGCSPEQVPLLLKLSQRMGITVKGLSFHAGSQCPNSDNHVRAILTCAGLIRDSARHLSGQGLGILNIGGGFPVSYIDEGSIYPHFLQQNPYSAHCTAGLCADYLRARSLYCGTGCHVASVRLWVQRFVMIAAGIIWTMDSTALSVVRFTTACATP